MPEEEIKVVLGRFDERLKAVEKGMPEMKQVLSQVLDRVNKLALDNASRPTWVVTATFTVMGALLSGMAVFIVTKL